MIRMLALVPSIPDRSPGQRYRLEQWLPILQKLGIHTKLEPFEDEELNSLLYQPGQLVRKMRLVARALGRRIRLLKSIPEYDLVYIFREAALLGPAFLERRIYRMDVPIIYDFDDAIFVRYISPSNGLLSLLKCAGKTQTICRMASHVTVGNRYLAEYALRAGSKATIIPTTIDTDKYTLEPGRASSSPPVIGWTGSHSTVQHLEGLKGVLTKLAGHDNFRLRVIGSDGFRFAGVQTDVIPWAAESEVADLRPVDIGIMPLPDNPWTRGKCACKALQYMGLGIPTVCSPVGANRDLIRDGVNGFLAGSENEWVDKLSRLLGSEDLRRKLGMEGRATVESEFSARVQAPRVFDILRSAACTARSANREPFEPGRKN